MSTKKYLITSALPYSNGPVHIGHLAGCYLPADTFVRFLKLQEKEVLFVSGTDEHGVPVTIRAQKEGTTVQNVVDKYHTIIKTSFENFDIDLDVFSRTTKAIHHETATAFFKEMYAHNQFVEIETEQYYDEKASTFLADRYITGTCPHCQNTNAYGDQCEQCGSSLNATDLINPKSMLSDAVPVLKKTKNWFLPLDKLQPQINAFIESHPEWKSNVKGQCESWLKQGLQPRAMTRDLNWGIPLPIDHTDGKVMYVWFEAPIGYISATKDYFQSINAPENTWESWWKDKDTQLIHFIGKDNIVFHCIIFPAMLIAHGDYILPTNVPANEFLNLEGQKISTSRNFAVWLDEYLIDLPDKTDELRYVLTSIAPETKDADFTWQDYQARINGELVAVLANFIHRVLTLINKNYDGIVPQDTVIKDVKLKNTVNEQIQILENSLQKYEFRFGLKAMMEIARIGNKYLADQEPWRLKAEEDKPKVVEILSNALQISGQLQILMQLFLPRASKHLAAMLNIKEPLKWKDLHQAFIFAKGHAIEKSNHLFKPIEDEVIALQVEKLKVIMN